VTPQLELVTDEELAALIRTYEAVCESEGGVLGLTLYWAQLHLSALQELEAYRKGAN